MLALAETLFLTYLGLQSVPVQRPLVRFIFFYKTMYLQITFYNDLKIIERVRTEARGTLKAILSFLLDLINFLRKNNFYIFFQKPSS